MNGQGGGGGGGNANQGRHRSQGSSVSSLVSTLIPVFVVAVVIFAAFLLLRKKFPRVYHPRTYLGSLRDWQKSPAQGKGSLGWRQQYAQLKDEFVMGHASLDNYLWIRFLRMLCAMCLVGCVITWPILFPVNATGSNSNATGLDVLSFSRVQPGTRYYAHAFVSWLFFAWVMFLITRETRFFVRLRQYYYLAPSQSTLISSKTVLFTNIPEEERTQEAICRRFEQVKKTWFMNVPDDVAQQVEDRDTAAGKLEQGEIKLLQNYVKRQRKAEKKAGKASGNDTHAQEVIEKDLPTHRLPKLKFLPIGKKVKTIEWARSELQHLIPEVSELQLKLKNDPSQNQGACFVEFHSVEAAHSALHQDGSLKKKMKITPKEYAPSPDTILWKNITKPFAKVQALNVMCTAFIWFLCIFWSIPVAVIGAISNINYLTTQVPFLGFIDSIPDVILGVVTGLLPVLLLKVLMALVPIVCAILAKLFEPTLGSVQMKVQAWYFPFQVIQVFLVTTFASGAASVAAQIVSQPQSAVTLLAENLPKASNFYISYFILFGLLTAAMQLLNAVPLLFMLVLGRFLDKTPRKKFDRYTTLAGLGWGPLYAKFTNLGVIALSYSTIAPLILGFATIGFFLLYLAFRYNVLFTLGTQTSTRGASYARAMQQLITGIYLSELCLIGLLAIGVGNSTQAVGPLVLEIVLLVATIVWHIWMKRSLKKLEATLPSGVQPAMKDHADQHDVEKSPRGQSDEHSARESNAKPAFATSPDRGGLWSRLKGFLYPETSAYSATLLVSSCLSDHTASYNDQDYSEAYMHPGAVSECPKIWIAKDSYGLSKQEIIASKKAIGEGLEMTDEQAWIDEKGKLQWNEEIRSAPIWEEPVAY